MPIILYPNCSGQTHFRILNFLDLEKGDVGPMPDIQNVSVESRAIPRIKVIVSLGKINEESIKWINQNSNISSSQVLLSNEEWHQI